MNGRPKTSPWVYVGIGCTTLVVMAVVGIGVMSFFGYRWAKQLEADLKDPGTREAKVKQVLGSESLPEGYHPMLSVSVPFVMDVAMLSDQPPDPGGQIHGFDERGFIYFQILNPRSKEQEVRDYFEGKTDDPSVLRRNGVDVSIRSKEVIRRGVFEMKGYAVMFVAQRGRMDLEHGHAEGVNALMLVDCPQDKRTRMAIWFGPDPDPEAPVAKADFGGSPGDEGAMRTFMGHFDLCTGAS